MTPKPSPASDLQTYQAWEGTTIHAFGNTRSLECPLCADTSAGCFPRETSPLPAPQEHPPEGIRGPNAPEKSCLSPVL